MIFIENKASNKNEIGSNDLNRIDVIENTHTGCMSHHACGFKEANECLENNHQCIFESHKDILKVIGSFQLSGIFYS